MPRRAASKVRRLVDKADILLEALPYIRRFSGKTVVVKYGGHAMVDAALQDSFAQDVVLMKFIGLNPVIVHGGGPQIGQMLSQLGIETRFVRGMRVTDQPTMDVVEMVLNKINQDIVSLINRHGGRAVGLSGKDGSLIRARKLRVRAAGQARVDIGMVGEVASIDPQVIAWLDQSDFIPVLTPVGTNAKGESFNINADVAAAEVAEALRAEKLILLTDVEGVRDADDRLVGTLDPRRARQLIRSGVIGEGMIPKVEYCLRALAGGVRKCHIVDGRVRHAVLLEVFTAEGVGTQVVRQPRAKPKTRESRP